MECAFSWALADEALDVLEILQLILSALEIPIPKQIPIWTITSADIIGRQKWPIFIWHTTDKIRLYWPTLSAINLAVGLGSNFADKIGGYNRPIFSFVCHQLKGTLHSKLALSPPLKIGAQNHLFWRLRYLIAYIVGTKCGIRKREVCCKLQGVSYIVSKWYELWSTDGLKLKLHFYPPQINSAYFIARLRRQEISSF